GGAGVGEFGGGGGGVAVADVDVVVGLPRDVGGLAEHAVDVHGRLAAAAAIVRLGRIVGPLGPPAEIHRHVARRIELHNRVRAFVDDPQTVVFLGTAAV